MIKIYKGKSVPVYPMKALRGEEKYGSTHHFISAQRQMAAVNCKPTALLPGKEVGSY